ncbi:hypothetical protein L6164_022944 [Bauhinia variegata]|uniref:Uncharacterized protein n=1 Tax=Bauhinia variegata TaxID=167791 RepID=A0ACB9MIM4_BAUVA|nr:hypothetical protein L6164_022944 [Bauhinia variegata]
MKRAAPWNDQVEILSDESASSDSAIEANSGYAVEQQPTYDIAIPEKMSEDVLIRRAEMYQEYMKQIPVPTLRGSVIPFTSWMGLGRSIKELYGQPLHYLTNVLLKQWDQSRMGSEDEYKPLDDIIHPCKAETSIWLIEEVHRQTSSPYHIAKLWQMDPMHHAFIDPVFPKLESTS